jgi:type II secretory pathway component PulM
MRQSVGFFVPSALFSVMMYLLIVISPSAVTEAFVAPGNKYINFVAPRQHVSSLNQTPTDVEALRAAAAKAREEVSRLEKVRIMRRQHTDEMESKWSNPIL